MRVPQARPRIERKTAMPTTNTGAPSKARVFRLHRTLPGFLRDPLTEIERIGTVSSGEITQIDLGLSKPYLVTHPDHIQHVLRDGQANYVRDGMLWHPLHRLFGDGILSDGVGWEMSRKVLQPAFAAKHIGSLTGRMAQIVNAAADELAPDAAEGRPIDAMTEMYRIVSRTVIGIMFGDKLTQEDMDRVVPAIDDIALSVTLRMLLPYIPDAVPLPGDRAYRAAVQAIDDVVLPLARRYHHEPGNGDDLVTLLCRTERPDGVEVTARWIRDNIVALLAAGIETTVVALTWLWPALRDHPEVAERLYAEIDRVVGRAPVAEAHLSELVYTRQVVQESLRLHPVAWWFPRMVLRSEILAGVPLKAGENVIITPFLTHRLPGFWERPLEFDPGRFAPDRSARRHRYAYFPFGGGRHQCMGMHLFNTEAQVIIAALLSRYRPEMVSSAPVTPRVAATLRPRQTVEIVLRPAGPA